MGGVRRREGRTIVNDLVFLDVEWWTRWSMLYRLYDVSRTSRMLGIFQVDEYYTQAPSTSSPPMKGRSKFRETAKIKKENARPWPPHLVTSNPLSMADAYLCISQFFTTRFSTLLRLQPSVKGQPLRHLLHEGTSCWVMFSHQLIWNAFQRTTPSPIATHLRARRTLSRTCMKHIVSRFRLSKNHRKKMQNLSFTNSISKNQCKQKKVRRVHCSARKVTNR